MNRPRRTTHLAGAALAAFVAWAGPATASQLDAFSDDVDVNVVNVDVVVTDRDGQPITGLGRDDFELRVDGKPVEVRNFLESRSSPRAPEADAAASPAADGAPAAPESPGAESRRRKASDQNLNLVVYLDRAYLGPGDLNDLVPALSRFLDEGLSTGDRVMVLSADRKVEVLHPLTTLVPVVAPLLNEELAKLGRGARIESEYRDILRTIEQLLTDGPDVEGRHPEHHTQALLARINAFSEEAYRDVALAADQLGQVIAVLAGLPGRNVVLYVGGRMPVSAGATLFSAWRNAFGLGSARWHTRRERGTDPGADPAAGGGANASLADDNTQFDAIATPDSSLDAGELFNRVARLAGAFGVRFYTLDATGQRTSAATRMSQGSRALASQSGGSQFGYRATQRVSSQGALADLSRVSGGRSLGESRNFSGLLEAMSRDLEAIYSLGFEPPEGFEDVLYEIEVQLRHYPKRKVRVRHREYHQSRSGDQEAAERTLSALLAATTDNPLGVEVTAGAASSRGEAQVVPLSIRVPLTHLALVAEAQAHTGRLTLFVTSGDLEHGAAPMKKVVLPVRIANEEILNVLGRHLEYTLDVEVPRGSRIAVGVRDDFAPLLSTVTLTVSSGAGAAAAQGSP